MVLFNPQNRPNSIDDILKNPWMKELNDLNDEGYKNLEKEVNELFQKLEKNSSDCNETVEKKKEPKKKKEGIRGISGKGREIKYFEDDLKPIFIYENELKLKKYMKIIGDINPVDFMNSLANKIIEEFGDNVTINESKYNLKFDIVFENEETTKEENEEMKKEIMEELNK